MAQPVPRYPCPSLVPSPCPQFVWLRRKEIRSQVVFVTGHHFGVVGTRFDQQVTSDVTCGDSAATRYIYSTSARPSEYVIDCFDADVSLECLVCYAYCADELSTIETPKWIRVCKISCTGRHVLVSAALESVLKH